MESRGDARPAALTVRERPNKTAFRFWQEGGGDDRNMDRDATRRAGVATVQTYPVRRELCRIPDDWPWSSWGWHHGRRDAEPSRLGCSQPPLSTNPAVV